MSEFMFTCLLFDFVRRHFVVATYTYKIIKRPGSYKRTGETDYGCLNKENFTCFPRITEVLLLIKVALRVGTEWCHLLSLIHI